MITLNTGKHYSAKVIAEAIINSDFAELELLECAMLLEFSDYMDEHQLNYVKLRPVTIAMRTGMTSQQVRESLDGLCNKKILFTRTKTMRGSIQWSFHRNALIAMEALGDLENVRESVQS